MDVSIALLASIEQFLSELEVPFTGESTSEFVTSNELVAEPSFEAWVSTLAQPSALFDETFDDLVVIATQADVRAAAELELSFWNS